MRHLRVRTVALAAVAASGVVAAAFGPATHAWLAEQITGSSRPSLLYGAIAPDMDAVYSLLLKDNDRHAALRNLTHRQFDLLPPGPFATGFATHNSLWGADSYAHAKAGPQQSKSDEPYFPAVARQLAQETGLSLDHANTYVEAAVDYLLRRDHGPRVGANLVQAALLSGHGTRQAAIDAFADPLAEALGDESPAGARHTIFIADTVFRLGALIYGSQLARDPDYLMTVMPLVLALYDNTDYRTASLRFARTIQLCEAYAPELQQIAAHVALDLETYAPSGRKK